MIPSALCATDPVPIIHKVIGLPVVIVSISLVVFWSALLWLRFQSSLGILLVMAFTSAPLGAVCVYLGYKVGAGHDRDLSSYIYAEYLAGVLSFAVCLVFGVRHCFFKSKRNPTG